MFRPFAQGRINNKKNKKRNDDDDDDDNNNNIVDNKCNNSNYTKRYCVNRTIFPEVQETEVYPSFRIKAVPYRNINRPKINNLCH